MTFKDLIEAHDRGEVLTVWVTSRGAYSDWRVTGIYSSLEEAKAAYPKHTFKGSSRPNYFYCSLHHEYDDVEIERYEMNPEVPNDLDDAPLREVREPYKECSKCGGKRQLASKDDQGNPILVDCSCLEQWMRNGGR